MQQSITMKKKAARDRQYTSHRFEVGDTVAIIIPQQQQVSKAKLASRITAPYHIKAVPTPDTPHVYQVVRPTHPTASMDIHVERIIPFNADRLTSKELRRLRNPGNTYQPARILDSRHRRGKAEEFLIRWKGTGIRDMWVGQSTLKGKEGQQLRRNYRRQVRKGRVDEKALLSRPPVASEPPPSALTQEVAAPDQVRLDLGAARAGETKVGGMHVRDQGPPTEGVGSPLKGTDDVSDSSQDTTYIIDTTHNIDGE